MKRITVSVKKENHDFIQRFRSEFIGITKEDMSYTEALNWLLHFGAYSFFGKETIKDFRERFYKAWAHSAGRQKFVMDEFLRAEGFERYII